MGHDILGLVRLRQLCTFLPPIWFGRLWGEFMVAVGSFADRQAMFAHLFKKWESEEDAAGVFTLHYTVLHVSKPIAQSIGPRRLSPLEIFLIRLLVACVWFEYDACREYLAARMKTDTVVGSMVKMQNTLRDLGLHYFWWQPQACMKPQQTAKSLTETTPSTRLKAGCTSQQISESL
eukprot:3593320-Amphidinium_carterae.1